MKNSFKQLQNGTGDQSLPSTAENLRKLSEKDNEGQGQGYAVDNPASDVSSSIQSTITFTRWTC